MMAITGQEARNDATLSSARPASKLPMARYLRRVYHMPRRRWRSCRGRRRPEGPRCHTILAVDIAGVDGMRIISIKRILADGLDASPWRYARDADAAFFALNAGRAQSRIYLFYMEILCAALNSRPLMRLDVDFVAMILRLMPWRLRFSPRHNSTHRRLRGDLLRSCALIARADLASISLISLCARKRSPRISRHAVMWPRISLLPAYKGTVGAISTNGNRRDYLRAARRDFGDFEGLVIHLRKHLMPADAQRRRCSTYFTIKMPISHAPLAEP